MTNEEFLQKLSTIRLELFEEVIEYYRRGEKELGEISMQRWSERFRGFLQSTVPDEAERWTEKYSMMGLASALVGSTGRGTHYERFMRRYGNQTLAFIENLRTEVEKRRIDVNALGAEILANASTHPGSAPHDSETAARSSTYQTQNIFHGPVGAVQQGTSNTSNLSQDTENKLGANSEEKKDKVSTTVMVPVVLGLLTLIGVIIAALLNNWDKFGSSVNANTQNATVSNKSEARSEDPSKETAGNVSTPSSIRSPELKKETTATPVSPPALPQKQSRDPLERLVSGVSPNNRDFLIVLLQTERRGQYIDRISNLSAKEARTRCEELQKTGLVELKTEGYTLPYCQINDEKNAETFGKDWVKRLEGLLKE